MSIHFERKYRILIKKNIFCFIHSKPEKFLNCFHIYLGNDFSWGFITSIVFCQEEHPNKTADPNQCWDLIQNRILPFPKKKGCHFIMNFKKSYLFETQWWYLILEKVTEVYRGTQKLGSSQCSKLSSFFLTRKDFLLTKSLIWKPNINI